MYIDYFQTNTSHIAAAMMADEGAFLQQTVCTFERMGSFSISNGFSVGQDFLLPGSLQKRTLRC